MDITIAQEAPAGATRTMNWRSLLIAAMLLTGCERHAPPQTPPVQAWTPDLSQEPKELAPPSSWITKPPSDAQRRAFFIAQSEQEIRRRDWRVAETKKMLAELELYSRSDRARYDALNKKCEPKNMAPDFDVSVSMFKCVANGFQH